MQSTAAGRELYAECRTLGGCRRGEAKITKGYNLPAKYVIHTVGPFWNGGNSGEEEVLTECYENSVRLALNNGIKTIAFPLISSGVYGYPVDEALKVAVKTLSAFGENQIDITLVLYDLRTYGLAKQIYKDFR